MKRRIQKKVEKRNRLKHLDYQIATLEGLLKRQSRRIKMLETKSTQAQKVLCAVLFKAEKEITITSDDVRDAPQFIVHCRAGGKDGMMSEYTFLRAKDAYLSPERCDFMGG